MAKKAVPFLVMLKFKPYVKDIAIFEAKSSTEVEAIIRRFAGPDFLWTVFGWGKESQCYEINTALMPLLKKEGL